MSLSWRRDSHISLFLVGSFNVAQNKPNLFAFYDLHFFSSFVIVLAGVMWRLKTLAIFLCIDAVEIRNLFLSSMIVCRFRVWNLKYTILYLDNFAWYFFHNIEAFLNPCQNCVGVGQKDDWSSESEQEGCWKIFYSLNFSNH